ncbi:hypothetical protein V6N13_041655 [Hibiscus sabdariffa]
MTRRKVTLAWITNNSNRRASLKKRRLGLIKKVKELTTLCGIDACLVIYSPQENEPMVWPSVDEVKRLVGKFYLVPELERSKKMMNMEIYMNEKLCKEQENLMKFNRKNKEVEVGQFMLQLHQGKMMDSFNVNELEALIWFGEAQRTNIRKHIEYYRQIPYSVAGPSGSGSGRDVPLLQLQPPALGPDSATADFDFGQRATDDPFLWDNWFQNIMKADEFGGGANGSIIRSDVGLTHYNPYAGTSSVSLHLGLTGSSYDGSTGIAPRSSFGGSSSAVAEHRPPGPPFVGSSSSVDQGLPPFGTDTDPPEELGEKKADDVDSYAKFLKNRKPLDMRMNEEGVTRNQDSSSSVGSGGVVRNSTEDIALLNALKAFPKDVAIRWETIAAAVPGKSKAACMMRVAEMKKDFRSSKAGN